MDPTILCLAISLVSSNGDAPLYESSIKSACRHAEQVIKVSEDTGIEPTLFASLIFVESRWDHRAVSSAGACGLTQVIPRFVKESCADLKKPKTSIRVGARILKYWKSHAEKKWPHESRKAALACYNAGWVCLKSRKARRYSSAVLRVERKIRKAIAFLTQKKK